MCSQILWGTCINMSPLLLFSFFPDVKAFVWPGVEPEEEPLVGANSCDWALAGEWVHLEWFYAVMF